MLATSVLYFRPRQLPYIRAITKKRVFDSKSGPTEIRFGFLVNFYPFNGLPGGQGVLVRLITLLLLEMAHLT